MSKETLNKTFQNIILSFFKKNLKKLVILSIFCILILFTFFF